jgi:hypothetical protein
LSLNPFTAEDETGHLEEPVEPIRGLLSYALAIENLYKDDPAITPAQAAKIAGCSKPTAKKWLERVKPVE